MSVSGRQALTAFVLCACLASCSSATATDPHARHDVAGDPKPLASPAPSHAREGSVKTAGTASVQYPNGVAARLVELEQLPNNIAGHIDGAGQVTPLPSQMALVKVSVMVSNKGTANIILLGGQDRYKAGQDAGFMGSESADRLTSKLPEQVSPGSQVTILKSFDLPADQLKTLSVRFSLVSEPGLEYTFKDAQFLLKALPASLSISAAAQVYQDMAASFNPLNDRYYNLLNGGGSIADIRAAAAELLNASQRNLELQRVTLWPETVQRAATNLIRAESDSDRYLARIPFSSTRNEANDLTTLFASADLTSAIREMRSSLGLPIVN
jgi:hypothetical protein